MFVLKKFALTVAAAALAMVSLPSGAASAAQADPAGHTNDSMSWVYKSRSGGCEGYHPGKATTGAVGVILGETKQVASYPDFFSGHGPVTLRGLLAGLPAKAKLKVSFVQQSEDSLCGSTTRFARIRANKHGVARLRSTTREVNILASSEQPCITYQVMFKLRGSTAVYATDFASGCFSQPLPQ